MAKHLRASVAFLFLATILLSPACNGKRIVEPPHNITQRADITEWADQLGRFAAGKITALELLLRLGEGPITDAEREHWSYERKEILLPDGYRIEELEVRVRAGGISNAPFVLIRINEVPCLPFQEFSASAGARSRVEFPPPPHDLHGQWVSGFARDFESGGRLLVASGHDSHNCVTLMTASTS